MRCGSLEVDGEKYDSCQISNRPLLLEITLCSSSESSANSCGASGTGRVLICGSWQIADGMSGYRVFCFFFLDKLLSTRGVTQIFAQCHNLKTRANQQILS